MVSYFITLKLKDEFSPIRGELIGILTIELAIGRLFRVEDGKLEIGSD